MLFSGNLDTTANTAAGRYLGIREFICSVVVRITVELRYQSKAVNKLGQAWGALMHHTAKSFQCLLG